MSNASEPRPGDYAKAYGLIAERCSHLSTDMATYRRSQCSDCLFEMFDRIRAEERERIAMKCDDLAYHNLAAAIRSRGEKP